MNLFFAYCDIPDVFLLVDAYLLSSRGLTDNRVLAHALKDFHFYYEFFFAEYFKKSGTRAVGDSIFQKISSMSDIPLLNKWTKFHKSQWNDL